jgi:uncharacterized membrane protein (DUF485 family)
MVESTNVMVQPSQPASRDEHKGNTNDPGPPELRDRVIRARLMIASGCALITLAVNLAFFTVMSSGAPIMARIVFGRSITLANVVGVGVILFYLAIVLAFERLTSRVRIRSVD